jgi:hypothetical protein
MKRDRSTGLNTADVASSGGADATSDATPVTEQFERGDWPPPEPYESRRHPLSPARR